MNLLVSRRSAVVLWPRKVVSVALIAANAQRIAVRRITYFSIPAQ